MPILRGACRDFLEDFSGFVDGTLDVRRRSLLIAHLDCCEACLRHLRAYRKGVAAFREAEPQEPAWGLYDRVVERLGEKGAEHPPVSAPSPDGHDRHTAGAIGAALVMAVLALFVIVPQAGRLGPSEAGPDAGTAAIVGAAPTSWASVIPAALPLPSVGQDETEGLRSSESSVRFRPARSEVWPAVDGLPEVPRRNVRMARFDDTRRSLPASGFAGWPPRRPPVMIDYEVSVYPATWVAEAALRIP